MLTTAAPVEEQKEDDKVARIKVAAADAKAQRLN
jgi:hypothetical protein